MSSAAEDLALHSHTVPIASDRLGSILARKAPVAAVKSPAHEAPGGPGPLDAVWWLLEVDCEAWVMARIGLSTKATGRLSAARIVRNARQRAKRVRGWRPLRLLEVA